MCIRDSIRTNPWLKAIALSAIVGTLHRLSSGTGGFCGVLARELALTPACAPKSCCLQPGETAFEEDQRLSCMVALHDPIHTTDHDAVVAPGIDGFGGATQIAQRTVQRRYSVLVTGCLLYTSRCV